MLVEPIMYFGIGFLVAALLTIGVIPLVNNRAVRLTERRLQASTPVSIAEIQADKDQLRAEFAMSTRRLEMSVEQMKAKTTSQLTEISKKAEAITKLKAELGEKNAAILATEARERAVKEQMKATEDEFAIKTASLREAERALADKKAELDKLSVHLTDRSIVADSQRVEAVALRAQVEALKGRVDHFDREARLVEDRLEQERKQAAEAARELVDERGRAGQLGGRVSDLERQLVIQTTEAELFGKRAQELETRLSEQGRLLAERDYECQQLRGEIAALRKSEAELRAAVDSTDQRHRDATATLRAEKAAADERLKQASEERAKLQRDIEAMKRDAESSWAEERVENALLRERINDVAAEVARIAVVLEGPDSPIDVILAGDAGQAATKSETLVPGMPSGESAKGTLADRIRALQSRASLVPTAAN